MTNQLDKPVAATLAVKNATAADPGFGRWVADCLARHRSADWGDVGLLTWKANNEDPEMAMSVYTVLPEHTHHVPAGCVTQSMWIKNDGLDITTIFWPSEY